MSQFMTERTTSGNRQVKDDVEAHRYEIDVDGQIATLAYQRRDSAIALIHTEVPVALRGRGLADGLAGFALDRARAAGLRVIPVCPFVKAYLKRHPDYQSLAQ
jgi:uncharacterized protein